jgi:hypothetical protein
LIACGESGGSEYLIVLQREGKISEADAQKSVVALKYVSLLAIERLWREYSPDSRNTDALEYAYIDNTHTE